MVNLAFYCDQIIPQNDAIDRQLVAILEARGGGRRIAYIPSGAEPDRRFFEARKQYYERLGLDLHLFFDTDNGMTTEVLDGLLACDAIHLSGGHTANFLRRLRRCALASHLRKWAKAGGVLVGTSAGAILMTPNIAVDALFSGGHPEDVAEGDALDLVPFQFFPHLDGKPSYLPDLLRYSLTTNHPIAACIDGDGLVVRGDKVICVGNPVWIEKGEVRNMSDVSLECMQIVAEPGSSGTTAGSTPV